MSYFDAGTAIIERLRTAVAPLHDLAKIGSSADLEAIAQSRSQVDRAAYVVFAGEQLPSALADRGARGAVQRVVQVWDVVLVLRNVRDQAGGQDALDAAGDIVLAIAGALAGWKPTVRAGELARVTPPPPAYANGFIYYALRFQTQLFTGSPQ